MSMRLLLVTVLAVTSSFAQTGTAGSTLDVKKRVPRYAGIKVHHKVAIQMRDVLELFKNDGIDLELNGATQTVLVDAYSFRKNKRLPQKAAAIAMGTNNDNGINIWVNLDIWDYMSYERQLMTLLHELGHDYFNLKHSDDKDNLMYWQLPEGRVTMKDVLTYYRQLAPLCKNKLQ
jgi:hypothetical protein